MSWRHSEWEQIKEQRYGDIGLASGIFRDKEIEFEAGADAMLTGLKSHSTYILQGDNSTKLIPNEKGGFLVFIPDEEN